MAGELTVAQAILLGIVQGLTEWLPVSSSGHLVLAQRFLGVEAPLFFELAVHLGTLVVVLVFFRQALAAMARAVLAAPAARRGGAPWRAVWWDHPDRRLAVLVVAGTLPTVAIALAFRDRFEGAFQSAAVVGWALLGMGVLLWATRRAAPAAPGRQLGWGDALLIGAMQGLAITPGISRSGSTVAAGLFRGLDRELAVRYSFLLSIPAILGATALQASGAALQEASGALPAYLAGVAAAMVVGYAALAGLVLIVRRQALHWFAPYCWALGGGVLAALHFGWA